MKLSKEMQSLKEKYLKVCREISDMNVPQIRERASWMFPEINFNSYDDVQVIAHVMQSEFERLLEE